MNELTGFLGNPQIAWFLVIWSIFWKGWALWKAASKKQLLWFLIILVINTLGILEIAYIFILSKFDLDKDKFKAIKDKAENFPA